jgi:hypothetical protein
MAADLRQLGIERSGLDVAHGTDPAATVATDARARVQWVDEGTVVGDVVVVGVRS